MAITVAGQTCKLPLHQYFFTNRHSVIIFFVMAVQKIFLQKTTAVTGRHTYTPGIAFNYLNCCLIDLMLERNGFGWDSGDEIIPVLFFSIIK